MDFLLYHTLDEKKTKPVENFLFYIQILIFCHQDKTLSFTPIMMACPQWPSNTCLSSEWQIPLLACPFQQARKILNFFSIVMWNPSKNLEHRDVSLKDMVLHQLMWIHHQMSRKVKSMGYIQWEFQWNVDKLDTSFKAGYQDTIYLD